MSEGKTKKGKTKAAPIDGEVEATQGRGKAASAATKEFPHSNDGKVEARKGRGKAAAIDGEAKEAKKKAREDKKAEALAPTLADPQGLISDDFFLGYGMCSVVAPQLGINGPSIVLGPLQRPKQNKALERLRLIAQTGEGLLRSAPVHALKFGVNPTLLDLTTLSKNVDGPFQQVKWQEGASSAQVKMYAGYHRRELVKELLEDTYNEYKKVEKLLQKSPTNPNHLQTKKELETILNDKGVWLVGFYDEKFAKDPKKSQTVLMQLSSNNSLSSHADTAVHHFNNIARTLAGCQSPEDRSTLLTFAQAGMPGDVSTLLYKHKDVVELLASVHGIDVFAVNGLTPGQMLESKKTSWGLLEPFIRGGYYQLIYVTSSIFNILGEGESINDVPASMYSERVAATFTRAANGSPSQSIDQLGNPVIMNKLAEIFDDAFEAHLKINLDYFGLRDSKTWSDAMEEYEKEVLKSVEDFVQTEVEGGNWEEPEIKILKHVETKLKHLLQDQRMTCYPFLPEMPCKMPMFSPGFQRGLFGIFKELTPALSLTGLWMVPGLTDFKSQRSGTKSKSTSEVATPSETCLILHHLSYFQHFGAPDGDWSHRDYPRSGMVYWSPDTKASRATEEVARLWLALDSFILEHRIVALLKYGTKIQTALSGKAEKFGEDYETIIKIALKKWCDQAYDTEKASRPTFRKADVVPRHCQQCPDTIYEDDGHHPFRKHPNFRRGFEWSTHNFLMSPANNNNEPLRLRYSQALWGDYQTLKTMINPFIKTEANVLLAFRAKLHSLITSTAGLHQWDFWYKQEPSPSTEPLRKTVDQDVPTLRAYLQNQRFHSTLTGAFTNLVKTLNKSGVCGVPMLGIDSDSGSDSDEDGEDAEDKRTGLLALHPALSLVLENFWVVAEEVHEDLAAVEHKHETHKMKKATWEMVLNNFPERGIPVSYASEYEVGKYYGEHVEVNECSNKSSDATKDSSKADSEQHKRPAEEEPEESEGHPSKKARMEQEPGSASQGPDEDSDADSTPTTRTPPLNQLALKPMS